MCLKYVLDFSAIDVSSIYLSYSNKKLNINFISYIIFMHNYFSFPIGIIFIFTEYVSSFIYFLMKGFLFLQFFASLEVHHNVCI